MRTEQLDFLKRLAAGIAAQFGSDCEVVVHDLQAPDPRATIIAIENGHVSGRHVGDGLPEVVARALEADPARVDDQLAYLTKTDGGKVLKSTAVCCRDRTGKPVAIFAINSDISLALAAQEALGNLTATGEAALGGAWRGAGAGHGPGPGAGHGAGAGHGSDAHGATAAGGVAGREACGRPHAVSDLLDELIDESVRIVGKPVALMGREDKVRAIGFLDDAGAFLITKSGQRVCAHFGISKFTLYSYMDEARHASGRVAEKDAGQRAGTAHGAAAGADAAAK